MEFCCESLDQVLTRISGWTIEFCCEFLDQQQAANFCIHALRWCGSYQNWEFNCLESQAKWYTSVHVRVSWYQQTDSNVSLESAERVIFPSEFQTANIEIAGGDFYMMMMVMTMMVMMMMMMMTMMVMMMMVMMLVCDDIIGKSSYRKVWILEWCPSF